MCQIRVEPIEPKSIFKPLIAFSLLCASCTEPKHKTYVPEGETPPVEKTAPVNDRPPAAQIALEVAFLPVQVAVAAAGQVLLPFYLIYLPVEYAVLQSQTIQPVNVLSANGKPIGTVYQKPEGSFFYSRETVACKGTAKLVKSGPKPWALKCNKKKKAALELEMITTRKASIYIGPVTFRDPASGEAEKRLVQCKGVYNQDGGVVQPFMLACAGGGHAVIVPTASNGDLYSFDFLFNATAD